MRLSQVAPHCTDQPEAPLAEFALEKDGLHSVGGVLYEPVSLQGCEAGEDLRALVARPHDRTAGPSVDCARLLLLDPVHINQMRPKAPDVNKLLPAVRASAGARLRLRL